MGDLTQHRESACIDPAQVEFDHGTSTPFTPLLL